MAPFSKDLGKGADIFGNATRLRTGKSRTPAAVQSAPHQLARCFGQKTDPIHHLGWGPLTVSLVDRREVLLAIEALRLEPSRPFTGTDPVHVPLSADLRRRVTGTGNRLPLDISHNSSNFDVF